MGIDAFGNIRIYAFDPSDPNTYKGKKLLAKATFYSGSQCTSMLRIRAKDTNSLSTVSISHKIGAFFSSSDTSNSVIIPIDETTFRRLQALQRKLVSHTPQTGGLNPLAY